MCHLNILVDTSDTVVFSHINQSPGEKQNSAVVLVWHLFASHPSFPTISKHDRG